jgi:K(+)-stimulated pyrophosphate-energized sodium pump
VELAVKLTVTNGSTLTHVLAAIFFAVSMCFVYRSFYGMRIGAAWPPSASAKSNG